MDSLCMKRLEQILARKRQVMNSIVEIEPMIREEEYATPIVEPITLPLEAMMQDSLREVSIDGAPMVMALEMSIEGCSKKDPIEVV